MANSSMPWVKLYLDLLDDPKIGKMPRSTRLRFIELMLLAGECDADGDLVSGGNFMSTLDIAWRLRDSVESVEADILALSDAGVLMVDDGGGICVTNFAKRQGRSQSEKREAWRTSKRNPKGIQKESKGNPSSRGEERREEKNREEGDGDKPPITFPPPPSADIADSTGQVIATEEARDSQQVRLWRSKLRRPLSPEATNAIYAHATDLQQLTEVIDYWLVQGWNPENVNGILSMYRGWPTDRRNPKNEKKAAPLTGKPAPVSYFGEGGVLDQAMNAVWGDMEVSDGN